jgi:hypothetical protein
MFLVLGGKFMKRLGFLFVVQLMCSVIMAQEMSGIITKGGKPKKGLVVTLRESGQTTTTDKYGRFYFEEAKPGDVLQVEVSSKKAARIPVSEARRLKIYIASSDFILNNGVLEQRLPYTATSNESLQGNVIESQQILASGFHRVSDVMRQYLTGITVNQTFYGSSFRIRGVNSVSADNEPLFVIDGAYLTGIDIDAILPVESVKRIQLHKDGSRWGVAGANGVIEITTFKL